MWSFFSSSSSRGLQQIIICHTIYFGGSWIKGEPHISPGSYRHSRVIVTQFWGCKIILKMCDRRQWQIEQYGMKTSHFGQAQHKEQCNDRSRHKQLCDARTTYKERDIAREYRWWTCRLLTVIINRWPCQLYTTLMGNDLTGLTMMYTWIMLGWKAINIRTKSLRVGSVLTWIVYGDR